MEIEWQDISLSKIAAYSQGLQVSVEKQFKEKNKELSRFIRIVDFTNENEEPRYIKTPNEKYFVNEEDIVMIRYGSQTAGKVVKGLSGVLANNMFKVNLNVDFISKEYLFLCLSENKIYQYLRNAQASSTMPAINFGIMNAIAIRYPTLPYQKAIAHIIGTIDEKIELNKKNNQTLEGIAKAIFKSWFIDFDPVRAKSEGRSTGLPDEISDLFPDSFENSELGEIPTKFSVSNIGQVSDFINGFPFSSKDWKSQGAGVVKIGSISPGLVDVSKVSYVGHHFLDTHKKYQVFSGDIVIGMTGAYLGQVGMIPIVENPLLLNQRTGKFAIKDENILSKSFLFYLINNHKFNQSVESLSYGSAQHNVSGNDICSMKFIQPTIKINKVFGDIGKSIIKKSLTNKAETFILLKIRTYLIPKLISGELRISDAEKIIEEAGI